MSKIFKTGIFYKPYLYFNLYYKKAMSINNKIIETKLNIGDQKQEQIKRIRLSLKELAKIIRKNNDK